MVTTRSGKTVSITLEVPQSSTDVPPSKAITPPSSPPSDPVPEIYPDCHCGFPVAERVCQGHGNPANRGRFDVCVRWSLGEEMPLLWLEGSIPRNSGTQLKSGNKRERRIDRIHSLLRRNTQYRNPPGRIKFNAADFTASALPVASPSHKSL